MSIVDRWAKKIWDYMRMDMNLQEADVIWLLGSNDIRIAEYGTKLYLDRWAPRIVFSGGVAHKDDLLGTGWNKSEAEMFVQVAIRMGIDDRKIWVENRSQNTGENIKFTCDLFKQKAFIPKKIIMVQKPFMLRRTYATFMKQWLGEKVGVIVSSPSISFEDYPNESISKEDLINVMVGDLQRIKEYPKLGFQIPQEIPEDVWEAYERLVNLGYTRHLIRG